MNSIGSSCPSPERSSGSNGMRNMWKETYYGTPEGRSHGGGDLPLNPMLPAVCWCSPSPLRRPHIPKHFQCFVRHPSRSRDQRCQISRCLCRVSDRSISSFMNFCAEWRKAVKFFLYMLMFFC